MLSKSLPGGATAGSSRLWRPVRPWFTGRKQLVEEGFEVVLSGKPRDACRRSDFRRREGGQADCLGLFQATQGTRTLDLTVVGEQGRGTRHRRSRSDPRSGARSKNTLQPHRRQYWVIPPKANSAFVADMEDVLAVYTRPRDSDCPLVCLDETSKQLVAKSRLPMPMKAGRPVRFDYEYERNGTANPS